MDAISDPSIEDVVVMKSAQVGWTEIIGNVVGYHIDQDPAPALVIQPTLEMGNAWSKDRLAPMLRDTPVLKGKVKDARARDSGNTILHKSYPGGQITIAGANSPAGLASRPIRIVLCDEVDRYPPSAGKEGDPINLARKRSATFWNRKFLAGSTPTVKGASRIEALYEESDQRRFHVPCPHCGHKQHLEWSNVKWPKTEDGTHEPSKAEYMCSDCGTLWDDAERWAAIADGEWVASKEFNGTAGFHLNEIYSPWSKLGEMAETFLEARKLPETLQTFVNTALGQTFEMVGATLEPDPLFNRRETYGGTVPDSVVLITAGLDTQPDRIEMEIVGWGDNLENWSIDYRVFLGDPDQPEIWREIDAALKERFETDDGRTLRIEAACIDSGGANTQAVYDFCKPRRARRVYAIRGQDGQGRTIWPLRAAKGGKGKGVVYTIGVDTAKARFYGWLALSDHGPGYCHFPITDRTGTERYDEEHFAQMTGEQAMTKYKHGRPYIVWETKKSRTRVEVLDCRVYAIAALEARAQPVGTVKFIDRRVRRLAKKREAEGAPDRVETPDTVMGETDRPEPTERERAVDPKPKRKRRPRKRGGFVNNW